MTSTRVSWALLGLIRMAMCVSAFGITALSQPTTPSLHDQWDVSGAYPSTFAGAPSSSAADYTTLAERLATGSGGTVPHDTQTQLMTSWYEESTLINDTSLDVVQDEFNGETTVAMETEVGYSWRELEWPWYNILQLISSVFGIVGNALVIVVMFQRRSRSRSTDTLVIGLAWADFMTSVFIIPIPLASRVPKNLAGEVYCKLMYSRMLLWTSVAASAYTLVAISVERFIAVVFPFRYRRLFTKKRSSILVLIIWIFSIIASIPPYIINTVDEDTNTCTDRNPSETTTIAIAYYWFVLRLVLPCLIMLVTQLLIARELHHQSIRFGDITNIQDQGSKVVVPSYHLVARNRVIKLMLIVILIFIVCWSPNQIAYLGYKLGWVPRTYLKSPLHLMLTVLGFYNSCVNPIIYAVRYPEFREAVNDFFTCKTPKNSALFDKGDVSSRAAVFVTDTSTSKI